MNHRPVRMTRARMVQLHLAIDTTNAAFDDNARAELARILRAVAESVSLDAAIPFAVFDENGNRVGQVTASYSAD